MKINRLSASAIDTYTQCNFKFFINYVARISDESSPSALLGTIGHKCCEILSRLSIIKHRKDSKYWHLDYLWKICIDHYFNEFPAVASEIKNPKLNAACKGLISLLNGPYTPISEKTIVAEKYFKMPLVDGLDISGRIDRIDQIDENTLEIMDWKLGSRMGFLSKSKKKKDSNDLHETIQAEIYFLAARYLYPNIKNVIVTFFFVTDGGAVSTSFDCSDIPKIKAKLFKHYKTIKADKEGRLEKGWWCSSICFYGKSGICRNLETEVLSDGFSFVEQKYLTLNILKNNKK